ncbi:MAG TPA: serine protease [Xanthomonadaceae bacterium]|jgi:S1-C subfamily serine protease|nr:serine protease [Xanthomonadaceae bacterium]
MLDGIGGHAATRWWMGMALAAAMLVPVVARAVSLDPALLPAIQAATFEVVAAKPAHDPLTYDKPLPLELLPFQERNDQYYSIGTAFAIGDGRYVTAAHVLLTGVDSLWGPPALRDNHGRVYAIDSVRKFSLERDFVEFTLAEAPPAAAALPVQTAPAQGQTVYSVGNAYGTGVVIRDGLYTSDTPEQQDGRWKWMRFSAPASPGNSGGPLVDAEGKVIGVVLAKSPNENLNYALPIGMVLQAPDGVAGIEQRIGYQFDVFDDRLSNTLKAEFALPLKLADFFRAYSQRTNAWFDEQLAALLAKDPARMFPDGAGTAELLHSIPTMGDFPKIVVRDDGGKWGIAGEQKDDYRLGANGYVTLGSYGNNMLFHLRRPDDVPAARLYADPAVPMDLLLKTGFAKRQVANQAIQVTSLGQPRASSRHTDAWGRGWRLWEWPLPYANAVLVVAALPVPDGYVGIARYAPALQAHDQAINLRALTDFTYANYDGTLAQWQDFLRDPALLPEALADTRIRAEFGKRFEYASPRMRLAFGPDLQAIGPDSILTLGFAFYRDGGKVVWDVAELWLSARSTENNFVMVVREQEPPAELGDDWRNDWERVLHRRHRYDGVSRHDNDATKVTGVVGPDAAAAPKVLYSATVAAEGSQPQEAMAAKLALLVAGLRVLE